MDQQTLKQKGSSQVVKATALVVLMIEIVWMLAETKGDFANGILFFMSKHNAYVLIMYAIFLGAAYLFGRRAAIDIVDVKKNVLLTALKYSVLTMIVAGAYVIVATVANSGEVTAALLFTAMLCIPVVIIWSWSAWRM